MRRSLIILIFVSIAAALDLKVQATHTGTVVKQLLALLKWAKSSPKIMQNGDGDVLQFEAGYFVETLVEGNKLGVVPHTIRVSPEGELFAVDSNSNNIVRITPPLSQYSRARLVAGSFQGYSGHVDGKPSDARFYHPKGVTMDDKGNVYVADTSNMAIRKIGESGVTTIAGGKSNVAGYRDGPSEDAQFSNDFDVVYVGSTCSLLVVDRGNAALRQISLQEEDCQYQYSSITTSDIVMVVAAVLAGYISCLMQQGLGHSVTQKRRPSKSKQHEGTSTEKHTLFVESLKEEPGAGWPSLGRLVLDLSKFAIEAFGSMLLNLIPIGLRNRQKTGLTPLKDRLVMPEDKAEPPLVSTPIVQKQTSHPPMPTVLHEPNRHETNIIGDSPQKTQKSSKTHKLKDASLSSKHRSSKRQEYGDMYSPTEGQLSSKSQKDRSRHRHREKSGENVFAALGPEQKPVKPVEYGDPKFDHYNLRSKFNPDNAFHY